MKIVIDISEEDFEKVKCGRGVVSMMRKAIIHGTPLPKGHGRLIDEKEVKKMIEEAKVNSEHSKTFAENIIKFAPTIIETDKTESEV